MSAHSAASPAVSAERGRRPPRSTAGRSRGCSPGTLAMAQAEMRKLRHDHLDIFTRSVQPLLWLFIFGTALQQPRADARAGSTTAPTSRPGVMAQAAMFIAIFFGLAVIWERDVGQLQRLLATPLPRTRDRARQGGRRVRARARAGGAAAVVSRSPASACAGASPACSARSRC